MVFDWHALSRDRRILFLLAIVVLALSLAVIRGMHFGIEFEGGTRLPLTLEKAVDAETMDEITSIIKTRVTKFGLSQVLVRGVGASEIYVEVPKGDPSFTQEIEKLVKEVGVFEAIVDGKQAVTSDDLIPGSIQEEGPSIQGSRVSWAVSFAITQETIKKFGAAALGKADYPVNMFLDRPDNAVIIAMRSDLFNETVDETDALRVLQDATRKENTSIPIFLADNWNQTRAILANYPRDNETKAVASESLSPEIISDIRAMGYTTVTKTKQEMAPELRVTNQKLGLESWPAIGLLSAPLLSADLAKGSVGQLYQISGYARGLTMDEQRASAVLEMKKLKSVLSGGALPVRVIMGSTTTIPAPLGAEFLRYSILGGLIALVAIVALVSIRYRAPKLILPIVFISVAELTILVCVIGAIGTIDLSAMAGIIAALGVSVDAQIIITDEIIHRETSTEASAKRRLEKAFAIIVTNAIVATAALLPLLFSGLVEIVGFATSTVLGYILGVFISRPAYGAIIEQLFGKDEQ